MHFSKIIALLQNGNMSRILQLSKDNIKNIDTYTEFDATFSPSSFQLEQKDDNTMLILVSKPLYPEIFTMGSYSIRDNTFTKIENNDLKTPYHL